MYFQDVISFSSGPFRLFGIWNLPAGSPRRTPAVIFCHGFTGHHVEARRMYARLAQRLALAGIATFRFDHRGCGESTGDFVDFTPQGLLEDLDQAWEVFAEDPRVDPARIGVVGYSLGGLSASYLLGRNPSVRTAVYWAGVARPDIIRDRLSQFPEFEGYETRGYMEYGGYRISRAYLDEIGVLMRPVEWASSFPGPILFCHGAEDDIVKVEQSERFLSARKNPADKLIVYPNADHGFGSATTIDALLDASFEWLQRHLLDVAQRDSSSGVQKL